MGKKKQRMTVDDAKSLLIAAIRYGMSVNDYGHPSDEELFTMFMEETFGVVSNTNQESLDT